MMYAAKELPNKLRTFPRPGDGHPRMMVLHWTGGEGGAEQVARTLAKRRLSVDFVVEKDGTIYQLNTNIAGRYTLHAGRANKASVGVEIVNYGYRATKLLVPRKGRDRTLQDQVIHGRKRKVAGFTNQQVLSVLRLTEWFCDEFDVPRQIPASSTELSEEDYRRFTGICGHLHVTKKKTDPGMQLFMMLRNMGYQYI